MESLLSAYAAEQKHKQHPLVARWLVNSERGAGEYAPAFFRVFAYEDARKKRAQGKKWLSS